MVGQKLVKAREKLRFVKRLVLAAVGDKVERRREERLQVARLAPEACQRDAVSERQMVEVLGDGKVKAQAAAVVVNVGAVAFTLAVGCVERFIGH